MKGGSNGNANNGGVTHNGEEQIYKWEVFTPLESMPIIKGTFATVVQLTGIIENTQTQSMDISITEKL